MDAGDSNRVTFAASRLRTGASAPVVVGSQRGSAPAPRLPPVGAFPLVTPRLGLVLCLFIGMEADKNVFI